MPDDDGAAADPDGLTVGVVATRLGVTIRTLHHWDEVGLVRPSQRSTSGYRLYDARDLDRLHRVVVYRELGLGLEQIRDVLDDRSTDVAAALRTQRAEVAGRIERLRTLDAGLARMIDAHERGPLLSAEAQAEVFGPGWDPRWPAQARERYGDTTQWREYAERSAARTPEQWQDLTEATAGLERALADAVQDGVVPGSPAADALVERHRDLFSRYFPLTRRMQVCLGRMYEADPAFTAHYDGAAAGLTAWLRQSIDASARAHGIDPETATWR